MEAEFLSKQQLLQEVRQAISAILTTGQTYSIGNRSLTRANITELRHLQTDLETELACESGQHDLLSGTYVGFFQGR